MLFKTDENLPAEIAELLRQHGHDALSIPDQHMSGERDSRVGQVCQLEKRALITLDLDFADIRTYPPEMHHGIIVLRPVVQNVTSLLRIVTRILPLVGQETLTGRLWIVDDLRIRIRGADSEAENEKS